MNKMKKILEGMEEAQKDAKMTLDDVPPKVRPGWAMRIAAAKEKMVELTKEYKQELNKAITKKYFITGEQNDVNTLIGRLGELEVDGLAIDAGTIYRRVADRVAGSIGLRGEFGATHYRLMNSVVGDIASENPDIELKDGVPNMAASITSYEMLFNHVRDCVRSSNGDKPNSELMNKRILNQALTLEWDEPTILFIKGATSDEIPYLSTALLGGPAEVLYVPPEPTLDWVKTKLGLNDIKESKKPKTKKNKDAVPEEN